MNARSDKFKQNHEQKLRNKYYNNIESTRNYSWNHQKIKHYQNINHEIMKYYSKKKLHQKNCQYINYCQKNYKNYKIILIVICEENIYNTSLTRQNIQSFLYEKKQKMMIVYKLLKT